MQKASISRGAISCLPLVTIAVFIATADSRAEVLLSVADLDFSQRPLADFALPDSLEAAVPKVLPAEDLPDVATETEAIEHLVVSGDNLIKIASQYRHRTGHYSLEDMLRDIRGANDLPGDLLRPGQRLVLPVATSGDHPLVAAPTADGSDLRAIYLTGPMCGYSAVFERVDRFIAAGGNGVIFDAKDIDGGVSFRSRQELASWGKGRSAPVIPSLNELVRRLDERQLYVVARLALFLDGEIGRQRPDLALQDAAGEPWSERGCYWMDPAQPEVRAYNIGLAVELARAGVDEIQFDYVRFPTNGWRADWEGDLEATAARRRQVITDFLVAAREALADFEVRISADLYGIMAWERIEDLALTGQHVPTFAQHVDVICPMIYPSHFGPGFEGYERPGDHPEYFISEGVRRFTALAAGQALIRPWLQAFPYRVSNYDASYVSRQIGAVALAGGAGWSLWNPACRYEEACNALLAVEATERELGPTATSLLPALAGTLAPRSAGAAGLR